MPSVWCIASLPPMQVLNGPLLSVIRLISFYISLIKRTSFNYDNKPYSPSLSLSLSLSLFDFAYLDEEEEEEEDSRSSINDARITMYRDKWMEDRVILLKLVPAVSFHRFKWTNDGWIMMGKDKWTEKRNFGEWSLMFCTLLVRIVSRLWETS